MVPGSGTLVTWSPYLRLHHAQETNSLGVPALPKNVTVAPCAETALAGLECACERLAYSTGLEWGHRESGTASYVREHAPRCGNMMIHFSKFPEK